MSELLDFAKNFSVLSLYSLLAGLLLYIVGQLFLRYKPFVNLWRDYWLVLIVLSALPIVFSLIPYSNSTFTVFDFIVFDLSQLQFTTIDSQYFESVLLHPDQIISGSTYNLLNLLSLIWLSIYVFGISYEVFRLGKKIKIIQSIISKSENIKTCEKLLGHKNYAQFNQLQKQKNINIVISCLYISPFVYQWRKKYLILPKSLFISSEISQLQIELIVEHELIHIKHKDQLIVMMSHFIVCLLWFNPFVKVFQKNMNWAIEAHCDSEVLNQKPHLRKIYAKTMLKILRQSATKTSNHMVAAFSTKTHRSLTMRINNIMKPFHPEVKLKSKKKNLWAGALSLGLLMFITQPQSHTTNSVAKTEMVNPVKHSKISSPYGAKNKIHKFHKGVDLSAAIGTPVIAVGAGVVRVSTDLLENKKNYGTLIIIDHADGYHSVYSHLNSREVSKGDSVEAAQLIGYAGETGKATGPHLHLELLKDNKHVNPSDYIKF